MIYLASHTLRTSSWHRPMLRFAALMTAMIVVSAAGLALDDRVLLGDPIWLKPFKFAISITLYSVTWAWLYALLDRGQRLAGRVSTGIVWVLFVEYVIIVTQVVRGEASHFNVGTPLNATLFSVMGVSIALLWTGTLILTVLVLRSRIEDAANRWAIRLGALISLAGLALGALMVGPTDAQSAAMDAGTFQGFVGAHSVGVPDGGPGMPITGWSTTGGDLRIPHFVGMHALQIMPLLAIALTVLARRRPALLTEAVRARLVVVAAAGYAGLVALVTWQALRGQSLIHPDALTMLAFGALVVGVTIGALYSLRDHATDNDIDRKVAKR